MAEGSNLGEAPPASSNELSRVVDALVTSYRSDPRGHQLGRHFVPSRREILAILDLLLPVLYPGYYGKSELSADELRYHTGSLVSELRAKLEAQIERCLCYHDEMRGVDVPRCRKYSREVAHELLRRLPAVRSVLLTDVQAALDGDPAASDTDEILLAYPGLYAVTVHRIAHELYALNVPLMPRIFSEHAHTQSGADIHPGATIGESFFIDHATGVVVGETAILGKGVKLYQGVTLGALSMPKDASGKLIRGTKRHPTVEDAVTIYANATVLGGDTVIGKGAVIGGGVFITRSVPPGTRVALDPPRLRVGGKAEIEFEI